MVATPKKLGLALHTIVKVDGSCLCEQVDQGSKRRKELHVTNAQLETPQAANFYYLSRREG